MKLSGFDAFLKGRGEHVISHTSAGAIITLVSLVVTAFLAISEFIYFQEVITEHHVKIDTRPGERNLSIALDISFFHLGCSELGLASKDSKGTPYPLDAQHLTFTEWEHEEGDSKLPGCRVAGTMDVRMVPGSVYFTLKQLLKPPSGPAVILNFGELTQFNASHRINSFLFGPTFPGKGSPLNDNVAVVFEAGAQWQYHMKVIPTMYVPLGAGEGEGIESEEYSVTQFLSSLTGDNPNLVQPGVFFHYDISPVIVWKQQTKKSTMQFITSLFAIVGGVFSVAGLCNAALHKGMAAVRKLD